MNIAENYAGGDSHYQASDALILGVDCSGAAASVALCCGATQLAGTSHAARYGHGSRLMGMIEAVLVKAETTLQDVGYIACGTGPGSFTGIRTALAAAKGLALGLEIAAVGLDSLSALSSRPLSDGNAFRLRLMDSRRGTLFSRLDDAADRPLTGICDLAPEALPQWLQSAMTAQGLKSAPLSVLGHDSTAVTALLSRAGMAASDAGHAEPDAGQHCRRLARLLAEDAEAWRRLPPEALYLSAPLLGPARQ